MAVKVNGNRLAVLQEERLSRGVDLYLRGRIRFPYRQRGDGLKVGKSLFGVIGDSGQMYIVELAGGRWTCGCPDFQKRGERLGVCKHIACVLAYKGEPRCMLCSRRAFPPPARRGRPKPPRPRPTPTTTGRPTWKTFCSGDRCWEPGFSPAPIPYDVRDWNFVKAVVTIYDTSGRVIDVNWGYVTLTKLMPGQTASFSTLFYGPHLSTMANYTVGAEGWR